MNKTISVQTKRLFFLEGVSWIFFMTPRMSSTNNIRSAMVTFHLFLSLSTPQDTLLHRYLLFWFLRIYFHIGYIRLQYHFVNNFKFFHIFMKTFSKKKTLYRQSLRSDLHQNAFHHLKKNDFLQETCLYLPHDLHHHEVVEHVLLFGIRTYLFYLWDVIHFVVHSL